MDTKERTVTIRIDASTKQVFDKICKQKDLSASQVIRAMVREYVRKNGQIDLFT